MSVTEEIYHLRTAAMDRVIQLRRNGFKATVRFEGFKFFVRYSK